jgi:hypothetical protein
MATDEERLLVRLEANSTKLIKEMSRASAEVKKRVAEIDGTVTRSNKRVSDGLGQGATAMRAAERSSRSMGFAVQNAAFQVGDFAVQVAGGTSATRAMAQQLPQLLGPLGVVGAVMGAVAAIAIPMASNFLFAADELKKIDAISLEGVRGRLEELRGLQEQYSAAIANSANVSEETTARILTALDTEYQAKLTLFRLEAITLEQRKRQLEQSLQSQKRNVDELVNLARLEEQLRFKDSGESGFQARLDSMLAQLAATAEMLAQNEDLVLEYQRQQAELDLVNLSLSEAQSLLGGATSFASGLGGALAGAASAAAALATNMAAANANRWIADNSPGGTSFLANQYAQYGAGRQAFDDRKQESSALYTPFKVATVKPGRGGAGGGRAATDPMAFLQQRIDTAQAAAEAARLEAQSILMGAEAAATAKAKFDLLQEAKRQNIDLDKASTKTGMTVREEIDKQSAAIGRLTVEAEKYREQAQFATKVNTDLKDGFLDAIVEGRNFGDVLASVAKQLARASLEAAIFGSGPFARSGGSGGLLSGLLGGGGGGGLLGGLFGGFRANGGPVQPGRAYVVGERQPELFVPDRAGQILPSAKAMQGGGGGSIMVMLSPGLEASILSKAQAQSIQIVQAGAAAQNRSLGPRVQALNARGTS